MPNRRLQVQGSRTANEFIHIDLLPRVKRPRQFNVNVLLIVLFAVLMTWIFIYIPLASRQSQLDTLLQENNDLQYKLLLVNEELVGYRIEDNRIRLSGYVTNAEAMQRDYTVYHDQIVALIDSYGGSIHFVRYDAVTNTFNYIVELNSSIAFRSLNWDFIDLAIIKQSTYSNPLQTDQLVRWRAVFTIEVHPDA